MPVIPKAIYAYSPRRSPELRFDPGGSADQLPELLAKATREPLTREEAGLLARRVDLLHHPGVLSRPQRLGQGVVDPDRFAALSGTVSLPFPAGKHKCVAVKVIDPRGNEVMRVHRM